MLDIKRIIDYRYKKDKAVDSEREIVRDTYSRLGFFDKRRLTKINNLINTITYTIEKESGWSYLPPTTFSFLDNFRYNGKEILFDINTLKDFKLQGNQSRVTIDFYNKYKGMLERLAKLLERRESLIPTEKSNVINFNLETKRMLKEREYEKAFMTSFVKAMSDEFVIKYSSIGISRLITFLNRLSIEEDSSKVYEALRREVGNKDYIQDILRWAALYNPKAQDILDRLADERNRSYYGEAPNMEEIMTQNIIKLL